MLVLRTAGVDHGLGDPVPRRPVLREHHVETDDERIKLIWGQVRKGLRDPSYRERAMRLSRHCASRDDTCELSSIFGDSERLKYVADVRGIDTYQSPQRTLAWGGGDCDDHVAKAMADAISIGFRAGARIIAPDGDEYTHIYAIVGVPKESPTRTLAIDTTVEGSFLGWEPPRSMRGKFRDFWYAEDDRGHAVAQLGASGGGRLGPILAAAGVVVVGAVVVAIIIWASRRRAA